ncbi:hypothetical protein Tco_1218135 [Tanacetum coccineum]
MQAVCNEPINLTFLHSEDPDHADPSISNRRKRARQNPQTRPPADELNNSTCVRHPTATVGSNSTGRVIQKSPTIKRASGEGCSSAHHGGSSPDYDDLGDCDQQCLYYRAAFWYGERLKGHSRNGRPDYHLCCGGGRIYMLPEPDPPEYIKHQFQNKHFMENIRAYNQMFAMTSFGAKIDESINTRREMEIPEFKIRLYNAEGARGYELPTSNTLGVIAFDSGPTSNTEFDVIIQHKDEPA